ncbi:MAG: response regulator transcription factor [Leptolyngbya sp.]|nr:response regulator transcription factor [Leptolyngbya sp.]
MRTILLVDDDPILLVALSRRFQAENYAVLQVRSARMALEAVATEAVDVVISDVTIPGMDGLEFCQRLRSTPPGLTMPFIFLSSLSSLSDRVQGYRVGADDYLTKPFHFKELLAKVQGALARSERFWGLQSPAHLAPTEAATEATPLPLTPAETKVFWEVVQGFTNKQIGGRLCLSPRTIQTHLSNILAKLGLENRSQLVRFAFEQGHQPPQDVSWEQRPRAMAVGG